MSKHDFPPDEFADRLARAREAIATTGLSCPFSRFRHEKFHPGLSFRFLPVMQACAVEGGH
jgi:hypothetical protein